MRFNDTTIALLTLLVTLLLWGADKYFEHVEETATISYVPSSMVAKRGATSIQLENDSTTYTSIERMEFVVSDPQSLDIIRRLDPEPVQGVNDSGVFRSGSWQGGKYIFDCRSNVEIAPRGRLTTVSVSMQNVRWIRCQFVGDLTLFYGEKSLTIPAVILLPNW
jgi:hypothetical protein